MPAKRLVRCILADDATRLPMPDRGGRFFAAGPEGETVDPGNPHYAAALAAGDIKKAESSASPVSGEPLSGAPAKTPKRSKSKGPDHG